MGAPLVRRIPESVGHAVSLVGGVATLAGLVLGFGAMAMMLFEIVYLVIKEEGVLLHDNGKEQTIAWSDLDRADLEDNVVILRRKSADAVRWIAGKDAKMIREKIDDARRKALHGLFKST